MEMAFILEIWSGLIEFKRSFIEVKISKSYNQKNFIKI